MRIFYRNKRCIDTRVGPLNTSPEPLTFFLENALTCAIQLSDTCVLHGRILNLCFNKPWKNLGSYTCVPDFFLNLHLCYYATYKALYTSMYSDRARATLRTCIYINMNLYCTVSFALFSFRGRIIIRDSLFIVFFFYFKLSSYFYIFVVLCIYLTSEFKAVWIFFYSKSVSTFLFPITRVKFIFTITCLHMSKSIKEKQEDTRQKLTCAIRKFTFS